MAWGDAQVCLAKIYLAQGRWEHARVQAEQASASSKRLGFGDLVLESASVLGQAWLRLGHKDRARMFSEQAVAVERQLAGTLPPAYASVFMQRGSEVGRI